MMHSKSVETPLVVGYTLSKSMYPKTDDEREQMKDVPYRSAIGSLMYAMVCTRPDICYAVGLVARFQSNPGLDHWQAVKRIMRYLKGTSHYSLCYHGDGSSKIYGFSDADLAGDPDGSRSTFGFAFKLANGLISWRSKKQSCVATSTMELLRCPMQRKKRYG